MFLGRDESQGDWKEWEIQAYIVQEARREGYFIEGDQNQAKRGYAAAARAKACGMQAGTPDLRVLLPQGKIIWIELKTGKGKLSPAQKEWHNKAGDLGFDTWLVHASNPKSGWEQVKDIIVYRRQNPKQKEPYDLP